MLNVLMLDVVIVNFLLLYVSTRSVVMLDVLMLSAVKLNIFVLFKDT